MSEPNPAPDSVPSCSCWRIFRRVVLALGLIALILLLAHRPLLVGFATRFRVDNPAPSDAMVILLGGADHRPAKAAELYRRGLSPLILIADSGVIPVLNINEAALTRDFLIKEGVPADAVQILPGKAVTSTRDESLRVRAYVRTHPVRTLLVTTTAFHTARARWILRRALQGTGVEVRMAAATHRLFNESDWWRTEAGLVSYFEELVKTVFYRLNY